MSDGMTDANSTLKTATRLHLVALGLKLAIARAKEGHQGVTVSVLDTVNPVLEGTGYRLVRFQEPKVLEGP